MSAESTRGVTTQMLMVCPTCGVGWPEESEPTCSDPEKHQHSPYEAHRHRTPVMFSSGAELWAVSFDANDPYSRDRAPDFGLYLDEKWAPPWEHVTVPWPDFGLPSDLDDLRDRLTAVLARAKAGERVEIGCLGAHGRTGTALACLAIIDGQAADRALAWVRTNYCEHAVETPEQEAFVRAFRAWQSPHA
jgi:protein-tyrosine phosphatase